MQVAVYGGSFNPPHVGHAMVASWLHWIGWADEVWLLPTYSHAFAKDLAPFEERVAMCTALAQSVGSWVRVETLEAELPAPSYTIDSLQELERRHPNVRLRVVVGADILPQLPMWKNWEGIERAYAPIGVGRQGYTSPVEAVQFPDISSTDVREGLLRGEDVAHLVPRSVLPIAKRLFPAQS